MTELVIGLATLSVIFLVAAWVLANRCLSMYREIQKLERSNQDLKYSVRSLKDENDRLHSQVYVNPDAERMTALRMSLHMKQEEIDALREKVKRQDQLLKQKWEDAKK